MLTVTHKRYQLQTLPAHYPVETGHTLSPPPHFVLIIHTIIATNQKTLNSIAFNFLTDSTLKIKFKYSSKLMNKVAMP